ncbi:MAG: DUF192 domain-containing protein [Alphaproteobacteria bacterium]
MKHALLISLFFLAAPAYAQDAPSVIDFGASELLTIESINGTHAFSVEIADTLEEKNRGLMYRDTLDADKGMLFEYDSPRVSSIWMKNTRIPLDILFIRSNGKILKIVHSAKPYTERSNSSEAIVGAVLELPGGRANELGIVPGDIVKHEFFNNVSEKTSE